MKTRFSPARCCCGACSYRVQAVRCSEDDPHPAGVPVVVKDPETGDVIAEGVTDAGGFFEFDPPEGSTDPVGISVTFGEDDCAVSADFELNCGETGFVDWYGERTLRIYVGEGCPGPITGLPPGEAEVTITDGDDDTYIGTPDPDHPGFKLFDVCKAGPWKIGATAGHDCEVKDGAGDEWRTFGCTAGAGVRIACWPALGLKVKVTGCGGIPLPGAVIATSGGSGETNGDGYWLWFPDEPGTYPGTVTHPSGRFEPKDIELFCPDPCEPIGEITYNLEPADGFACYSIGQAAGSPYPLPPVMNADDGFGQMTATIGTGGVFRFCHAVTLDHAGTSSGSVNCPNPITGPCESPPTDGTPLSINVLYKVGFNPTIPPPIASWAAEQFIGKGYNRLAGLPLAWKSPCVAGPCVPRNTSSEWRYNAGCSNMDADASNYRYTGTGLTIATVVHSVLPWHATHYFIDGDGIFDEPYTGSNAPHTGTYASGSIEVYE